VRAENLHEYLAAMYANRPLILFGEDDDDIPSTISSSFVLRMLDLLRLRPGHKVFELGAGSPAGVAQMRSRTFRDAARVGVRGQLHHDFTTFPCMFRAGTERRPQRAPQGFKPRYAVVQPESPSPHRRWAVPGARGRACACMGDNVYSRELASHPRTEHRLSPARYYGIHLTADATKHYSVAAVHGELVGGRRPVACVRDTGQQETGVPRMRAFEVKILLWIVLAVIIGLIALWFAY